MPPNGDTVHPESVHAKPFFSKRKLNARLNLGVFSGAVRSNSLPSGHTDLDCRHPRLGEDFLKGVLVSKVSSTPFGPQLEKDEAAEDVEGLFWVGEVSRVVSEESRGVVLFLQSSFPEEHEGPREGKAFRGFLFLPDSL